MKCIEMYVAEDGKVFNNASECLKYEYESAILDINKTAHRVRFNSPITSITYGEMILFRAETKDELTSMTKFFANNAPYTKDVYGDDKDDYMFPSDFVIIIPDGYDRIQVESLTSVSVGMRLMMEEIDAYCKKMEEK